MKSPIILHTKTLLLISGLALFVTALQAQTRRDTLRQHYINYLNRHYAIPIASAVKFVTLEDNYRSGYLQILNDRTTGDHAKSLAINQLIHNKNTQLAGLLTPEQVLRLVPLREITRNIDSMILLNGIRHYLIKLDVDINTAGKVQAIFQNYQKNVYAIGRDDSKSVDEATRLVREQAQLRKSQLQALLPPEKFRILYPAPLTVKDFPVIPQDALALSEAYRKKLKSIQAQTNLSTQDKKLMILALMKAHRDTMRKILAVEPLQMPVSGN